MFNTKIHTNKILLVILIEVLLYFYACCAGPSCTNTLTSCAGTQLVNSG